MIHYLVTAEHPYTVDAYLASWGRAMAPMVNVLTYEELPAADDLADGAFVFSDLERLGDGQRADATALWDTLAARGERVRLLNHPQQAMMRYELLRALKDVGMNLFNVFRPSEPLHDLEFPVFLRPEVEHHGAYTGLIGDFDQLEVELRKQEEQGRSRDDLLIVEFCDTSAGTGRFQKYGAFCVGGTVVPRHVYGRSEWMIKEPAELDDAEARFELKYLHENPHGERLQDLFAMARIDYGRVDYALKDGQMQVWEINTNPVITLLPDAYAANRIEAQKWFCDRFGRELRALDVEPTSGSLLGRLFGRRGKRG